MSDQAVAVVPVAVETAAPSVPAVVDSTGPVSGFHAKETAKAGIIASATKAKLAEKVAALDAPETETEAKAEAKVAGEKPTEAKKPETKDRSVATIAKQSQEIRDLKAKIATFEGKPGIETKTDFIEKLKADPSLLYKEIDDPELLTKLANARYRELSPEEQFKADVEARLAANDKKLQDAEKATKDAEAKNVDTNVYNATAQFLNHGYKDETGKVIVDNTKWPLCQKATKAGLDDAPRDAMKLMTAMMRDLKKTDASRVFSDTEAVSLLDLAYDQLETDYRKKAEVLRLDPPATEEATKTTTVRAADRTPKSLSNARSGGRTPAPTPPKSADEQKAEIIERHRQQRIRERALAA